MNESTKSWNDVDPDVNLADVDPTAEKKRIHLPFVDRDGLVRLGADVLTENFGGD